MPRDTRVRRGRRTWPQRLLILFNVGTIMVFLTTAVGLGYAYTKFGRLPRVELGEFLTTNSDESGTVAENFLVVGVDSADGLDPDDPVRSTRSNVGGLRSDTMMILRVDPASSRAALLSIPRDLLVPVPGLRAPERINVAVSIGGPERLVETVQNYFGIPINHYVQVDFFGFHRLVDAIGGVPIYFPHPVRDSKTGLFVPEAGCVTLDAKNALGFVRSRSYQELIDGRWRTDGSGDIGRVRRQQDFIQRALVQTVAAGIRNPVTVDELIDAGLDAVAVDDTLSANDMIDLAKQFRNFTASALDIYELPVFDDQVGGADVLRLDERRAESTLDIFRAVDPSLVSEEQVRVRVLNGTGRPAEASTTAALLREEDFSIALISDAAKLDHVRTEIRYPEGKGPQADLLNRWLVEEARQIKDDDVSGVTLITGLDFDGLLDEPREAGPTTTTTLPSTTTTTLSRSRSTTTILGTIPIETPEQLSCR